MATASAMSCRLGAPASCSRTPPAATTGRPALAAFRCQAQRVVRCSAGAGEASEAAAVAVCRRGLLATGAALAACGVADLPSNVLAEAAEVVAPEWEKITLPVSDGTVLLDIGFEGEDPNHGFILGTRQTLLETTDAGKTWTKRDIPQAQDEGINYRFQAISFNGKEGWIVGKPAILLHTKNGGTSWERVPLSAKLPGSPLLITALAGKEGQAELVTDQGAIYVTSNGGYNWTAGVQETVDATLNRTVSSGISGASYYEGYFSMVKRSPAGDYVAVSSRGNFYMTWIPGQEYWQPHNRPTARRVQAMGWDPKQRIWLTTRGGGVFIGNKEGVVDSDSFNSITLESRGFGVLDVGYSTDGKVGYACGGSGSLFKSTDIGKTWKRVRGTDDVAGNLYEVKFFGEKGFVLGNDGILLRYIA